MCTSLVCGARTTLPSALGPAHAHPVDPSSPQGALRRAPAAPPSGPGVPHAPPGRRASTRPRDSRLARAAPPGGGGWPEPCSLTVFFLATIFSSFLAIRSSSASRPMLARDARPARGAGAAGGAKAEGARRRGPQTHTTHTPAGAGLSPPHTPLGPPASQPQGGGVTCTKYRLQGLARAKFARAGGPGLPRGTRLRERALLPKGDLASGEPVVPGHESPRVPQRSGRSPGSSVPAGSSQLQAGGPSSVPAPKCRQLRALGSCFLRGGQIQLCAAGVRSFRPRPVYTRVSRPSSSICFVCRSEVCVSNKLPRVQQGGLPQDCSLSREGLGDS